MPRGLVAEPSLDELLTKRESEGGSYARHVENLRAELFDLRRKLAVLRPVKPSAVPRTHLVIGDSHAEPGVNNDRYRWLGRMCADLRPDVVIDIGDWADMPSLSSYDKGKRAFEGRRYWKDIEAAKDAREKFAGEIRRARGYRPILIHTEGNHEARIDRATDEKPELDGLISTKDLGAEEFGWQVHKMLVPVVVDGVCYSHYHPSGVKNKAIGGMNGAATLIRLGHMSCIAGHAHTYDYSEQTRRDGQKLMGVIVGCYFDHFMPWAGTANSMYWRGIVVIEGVQNGFGAVRKYDMAEIKRRYG